MQPLQLLRALNENGVFKKYKVNLKWLKEVTNLNCDTSTLSRILGGQINNGTNFEDLSQAIKNPEVSTIIAKQFECDSFMGIEGVIKRLEEQNSVTSPNMNQNTFQKNVDPTSTIKCSTRPSPYQLGAEEIEALTYLSDRICEPNTGPMVVWGAELWSGASFIAHNLAYSEGVSEHYSKIVSIRPSSTKEPYTDELIKLAAELGVNTNTKLFGSALREALSKKRILLVINSAEYITSSILKEIHLPISKVVKVSNKETREWGKKPVLLVVGKSGDRAIFGKEISNDIDRLLAVKPKRRQELFQSQLTRFSKIRGYGENNKGRSRRKRAKWHYETIKDQRVWAINIRLRAFFASNLENHSYFDPTSGFHELAGIAFSNHINLPTDILLFLTDIYCYLDRIDLSSARERKKRRTDLHALRLTSTAKYWLTEHALAILSTANGNLNTPNLKKDRFLKTTEELPDAIREVSLASERSVHRQNSVSTFAVSISIKSIVQEHWKQDDPLSRALAHWRIAKRLYDNQNNKNLLALEFPYEPHWGRTRIFYLSETIRHLIRSCEASKCDPTVELTSNIRTEFPDPPTRAGQGCDPTQVWSFCFGHLLQNEMNGNHRAEKSRTLAKRHGAYELTIQLLQLLSNERKVGEPHWALHEDHHREFRREAAFALLDIGKLHQARSIFTKMQREAASLEPWERVEDPLSIALVDTLKGDVKSAKQSLKTASDILDEIDLVTLNKAHRRRKAEIKRRFFAREAELKILEGDFQNSLDRYERLQKKRPLKGEIAHCYITAKIHMASRSTNARLRHNHFEDAVMLCIANMIQSHSEGKNHEAMGFQISHAGLLRDSMNYNSAAEETLNNVYKNILRFGCSERTYLSFLNQAGATLVAQGRNIRAYASYLKPCLKRAQSQGHWSESKLAAKYSIQALQNLISLYHEVDLTSWDAEFDKSLEDEIKQIEIDKPQAIGQFARDPLYGFQAGERSAALSKMRNIDYLQTELLVAEKYLAARYRNTKK